MIGEGKTPLTNFKSGQRVVNNADQHPFSFQRVCYSVEQEASSLLLCCFDEHVAPVEVPSEKKSQK